MATMLRSYNDEEVKVHLDANSALEVDSDDVERSEDDESFEEEEEKEVRKWLSLEYALGSLML